MRTFIEHQNVSHNGRTIAGIIILIIGGLLLVDQLDLFFIPNWLFSWPMWLIGWGVYMGGKYNFKKSNGDIGVDGILISRGNYS